MHDAIDQDLVLRWEIKDIDAALERGLIDGIGHFRPLLQQRFGKKVKIIPIKAKVPLLRRLGGGGFAAEDVADSLFSMADERLARQRFGG